MSFYLISSDEISLNLEIIEDIKNIAKRKGFTEFHKFQLDKYFDINLLFLKINNFSLFSKKKFFEIKNTGKLHKKLPYIISKLTENSILDNNLIIITTPKIALKKNNIKWIQKIQKIGAEILVEFPDNKNYISWLKERSVKYHLDLTGFELSIIANETQGNLSDSIQILKKISIKNFSVNNVKKFLNENKSHFNLFQLVSKILQGYDIIKFLDLLIEEREIELNIFIWILSKKIRIIASLYEISDINQKNFLKEMQLSKNQKTDLTNSVQYFSYTLCLEILKDLSLLDQKIKNFFENEEIILDLKKILLKILLKINKNH